MQTYKEALSWLSELSAHGIRPGLDRVRMMLEGLGNPERRLKSIHVGGTNGKGSTTAFLKEPMKEAGLVCGTFTSPYVHEFRERIAVNGEPVSEEDFLKSAQAVRPVVESVAKTPFGPPTEFEVLTVIAAHYFASSAFPDVVVWEVGLGGRLDSTNAVHPMISIITNVGHDHQAILGDTIEEIAREKAGIIKSGVPVVTCDTNPEVTEIFEEAAEDARTRLYRLDRDFHVTHAEPESSGWTFSFQSILNHIPDLKISMLGRHQTKNAAAALMAFRYLMLYYALPVDEDHIRRGLQKASWIGRMDYRETTPPLLLDGAHNKEGMESLVEALEDHFPERPIHLIVGMTKEKDPAVLLEPLKTLPIQSAAVVGFDFFRAASAEETAAQSPIPDTKALSDWKAAWEKMKQTASPGDIIVAAGSLYFISEVAAEEKK
ncbi:bifunctional folylpolyglutamate synthase/dihydrofolate synthase [Salibacterium qingdaonense]|uniref:Dihydrofolate synthase/folylpolyglutamate synthase n=1 Tax=Salibacterium qingdaonense TaxID=266892 RepID=A0A1I4MSK5_9BACI|nr:folylpolyglutamate synthase/dihydrofolate synthase family protein [Salibacterium qingdaonense]SFM06060.1 dihydrofolate synthase / folylpolyglutamate synthase [Salibacterium qingdaonense]